MTENIWSNKDKAIFKSISLSVKSELYERVVVSTVTYEAEK